MIIKRVAIKNFGRIHDRTMEFAPGMNVLYGENESGKTTTHTFVKSMLYGSRGREDGPPVRMRIQSICPGKIRRYTAESSGSKTEEKISVCQEIFIKKIRRVNFSVRTTERSWISNRGIWTRFWAASARRSTKIQFRSLS